MKAMVLHAFNQPLRAEEVPVPVPGPREVLLKVRFCGICGTDLKIVGGKLPAIISPPHVPGHEIAGEIAAVDAGCRGPGRRPGDRTLYATCHDCELAAPATRTSASRCAGWGSSCPAASANT